MGGGRGRGGSGGGMGLMDKLGSCRLTILVTTFCCYAHLALQSVQAVIRDRYIFITHKFATL